MGEEQVRIAKECEEEEEARKEAERARLAEIDAEKKKKQKAEINATKKQRKIFRNQAKENNYWVAENEQIAMMENVEFICQAFDSTKLSEVNSTLTSKPATEHAAYVNECIAQHKKREAVREEKLNEKLKTE